MVLSGNASILFSLWCEVSEIECTVSQLSHDEYNEITSSQFDSLDTIKFLVLVEEAFGIEFGDDLLSSDSVNLFQIILTYINTYGSGDNTMVE